MAGLAAFTVCVLAEAQAGVARPARTAPAPRRAAGQGRAPGRPGGTGLRRTRRVYPVGVSDGRGQPAQPGHDGRSGARPATPCQPACAGSPDRRMGAIPAPATRLITVRPGDCLWSIAQRYLGAGDRYPEIVSLNYGHQMAGGEVFTNPSLIEPGWQLFVPGDAAGRLAATATSGSHHLGHGTQGLPFSATAPGGAAAHSPKSTPLTQAGNVAARAAAAVSSRGPGRSPTRELPRPIRPRGRRRAHR